MSEVLDDYSTPEAALASWKAAYTRRDMEAVIRGIDFREEAGDRLAGAADERSVDDLAARLEAEYRRFLEKEGFARGFDIGNSKIVSKLSQTDTAAKFALSSNSVKNATVVLSFRLVRGPGGWRIVRTHRSHEQTGR